MNRSELSVGLRVRLVRHVEIFPIGIFPPGLRGTVTSVEAAAPFWGMVAMVRLDRHFPGLDGWDNSLQVWETDEAGGCVLDDLARDDVPPARGDIEFEFPAYDQSTLPVIPVGFQPTHWHNDACPSWQSGDLRLWVDFADPAQRDCPDGRRFHLYREVDGEIRQTLVWSDDWREVLAALQQIRGY